MKPEKYHAADYTPSEVEAAKLVMIEVAQNLGEYADAWRLEREPGFGRVFAGYAH